MASSLAELISEYKNGYPNADSLSREWVLINTPSVIMVTSALYLLFVWLGPKFMKNRKAPDLTNLMSVYNLGLVAFSIYMMVQLLVGTWEADGGFICPTFDYATRGSRSTRAANAMWLYLLSKLIEMLDTVFMVLRKKDYQLSFLHVYHHVSVPFMTWLMALYAPVGILSFSASCNCCVHIVMYTYYGLCVFPSLKKYLWWKKYITRFQLVQFTFYIANLTYHILAKCDFPVDAFLLKIALVYHLSLFAFFGNFYTKAYRKADGKAE